MLIRRDGMALARWSTALALVAALVAAIGWRADVHAQLPLQPVGSVFEMTGFIQNATVDNVNDVFSGGTITLNNHLVTVPRNTILQMPARSVTWSELFKLAPFPYGPTQTGMALNDVPKPLTTFEVIVQGNRVEPAGTYIAGLIFLAQQSLQTHQGFINFIDYTTGDLYVGGTVNVPNGTRVRINDPIGRFGRVMSHDVRFTIDEENPTIKTETAFPLCIPRTANGLGDPLCPDGNRPLDSATLRPKMIFTMPPAAVPTAGERANPASRPVPAGGDPWRMAPFEVGDYVTVKGPLVADPLDLLNPARRYVSAWGIDGNVGIFTTPGTLPAYVSVDVLLMGTGPTSANVTLAQEAARRMRVEGFTTDISTAISINAVDVDACTGIGTDRLWAIQAVDPGPGLLLRGAVAGRWRFRPGAPLFNLKGFPFLPPTREAHAFSLNGIVSITSNSIGSPTIVTTAVPNLLTTGGVVTITGNVGSVPSINGAFTVTVLTPTTFSIPVNVTAAGIGGTVAPRVISLNGLTAGSYTLPNFQFIGPENLKVGAPPVPFNFDTMQFLAQGSGPYFGAGPLQTALPQGIVGQIAPFPGTVAPALAGCATLAPTDPLITTQAPLASAGPSQVVASGSVVTLTGSSSYPTPAPVGATLTPPVVFSWTQISGPSVLPVPTTTPVVSFSAPFIPAASPAIGYEFLLTVNNGVYAATSTVRVTVNPGLVPIVSLVPAQTVLESTTVTLDASGTIDPNVPKFPGFPPTTFAWTQTAGAPAVGLNNANTSIATFNAPLVPAGQLGTNALTFAVAINNGAAIVNPTTSVTITALPPTASVGADQSVPIGSTVTLPGVASAPNPARNGLLTYLWKQTGGPIVTLGTPTALSTTFTAPTFAAGALAQTLTFTLTVDNGALATTSAPVNVTVNSPRLAPTASAGTNQTVSTGSPVTLTGSGTDPNNPALALTYAWAQTGGPLVTLATPTAASTTFTAPTVADGALAQTLTFTLTVTNSATLFTTSAPVTVTVTSPRLAPTANAGAAQSVLSASAVTLTGSGVDPNNPVLPLTFAWSQPALQGIALTGTNPVTFTAPTLAPGAASVILSFTVTASNGVLSTLATTTVTVTAPPPPPPQPLAVVSLIAGPRDAATGSVLLTATVTGGVAPISVTFFDGLVSLGPGASGVGSNFTLTTLVVVAGPHSITAVATDSAIPATSTTSAAIIITVL